MKEGMKQKKSLANKIDVSNPLTLGDKVSHVWLKLFP